MKTPALDQRVRVTRMLIRRSFLELLKQKPIQNISVREICEAAGINRGTFYSHYTDIYDLQHKIEDEMLRDFENALSPLLSEADHDLNPLKITAGVFVCLQANSDLCTVVLGEHGDKDFTWKLLNIGREKCLAAYSKLFREATPKQIDYFYVFVSSGCIGLLRKWMDDGMVMPASEIARMVENLLECCTQFLQTPFPPGL